VRSLVAIGIVAALATGCVSSDATASPSDTDSPSPTQSRPALPTDMPNPTQTAGPPPLNDLEVAVIDALAELGLTGMRAELPYEDAGILTVHALRVDRDRGEFVVTGTRQSGAIEVEAGALSPSSGDRRRFHCGDLRYYVGGTAPPPFADLDAFVDAFISVIDCTPPPAGT
jgi:hypothetical protein